MGDDPKKLRAALDEAIELIDLQKYSIDEHRKLLQKNQQNLDKFTKQINHLFWIWLASYLVLLAIMFWRIFT